MQIRELSVPDSFEITPTIRNDDRGSFLEWYRFDFLADVVGHALDLRQANTSVSRRGVVRGVHFADVPPGQAKYVTVSHGAVIDYVVDVRVGSPTFGHWDSVALDSETRKAVYLGEGLGHAFVALTNDATVSYLVSDVYRPEAEHGINPRDPDIGLNFPLDAGDLILSSKDEAAPTLDEARRYGRLPQWPTVVAHTASLNQA